MFYYKTFVLNELTQVDISLLMAVGSMSLLLFDFPSGNISDIMGRKKAAGIGIALWGIGLCSFSVSNSFYYFLISIIIFNLGIALESGSLTSWLHSYLVKNKATDMWDKAVSDVTFYQNFIKFFLNGVLLILVSMIKFNIIFISGIILILLGIFVFWWKKEEENYGRNNNLISSVIDNFKFIFKNHSIKKLVIIKFMSGIFLASFLLVYPYKFINQFKFDEEILPYMYFGLNFAMVLGSYIYKKFLLNRFLINRIYKSNIILGLLSALLVVFANNLIMFFLGIVLFEIFFVINMTSFGTLQYNYFPDDKKTAMVSALSSIGSLSSALSFIVVGIFLENPQYMLFLGVLVLGSSLCILFSMNGLEKEQSKVR